MPSKKIEAPLANEMPIGCGMDNHTNHESSPYARPVPHIVLPPRPRGSGRPRRYGYDITAYYVIHVVTGCWEWLAAINRGGYGYLWLDGRHQLAHRVFYEAHYGPVPDRLEVDHLCENTRCVNPDHLEAVTGEENNRRGN